MIAPIREKTATTSTRGPTHQSIWRSIGSASTIVCKLHDELGPVRLCEVEVRALALDDVGEPLQEIDDLLGTNGHGRHRQWLTRPILDLHLSPAPFRGGFGSSTILRPMPQDIRLLDDEQRALVQMVREFATAEAKPLSIDYEARSEDPKPLYNKLAELGLTGVPFPEEHGGGGQPYSTYLLIVEELATAYLALAIGLSVHTLCAFAINEFGTEDQKKEVLEKLTAGEWFGAYALSEPSSGSDAAALTSKAVRDGDSYRLSGTKVFCTRGDEADVVLVLARTGEVRPAGHLVVPGREGDARIRWLEEGRQDGLAFVADLDAVAR